MAPGNAAVQSLASDEFNRTVARGWGTASVGGDWVQDSTLYTSVNGTEGLIQVPRGANRYAYLSTPDATGQVSVGATFTFATVPTRGGGVTAGLVLQRSGDTQYVAAVRVARDGNAFLSLWAQSLPWFKSRLTPETLIGTVAAGQEVRIQAETAGGASAVLRAKAVANPSSAPLPEDWQVQASSSAIVTDGNAGVYAAVDRFSQSSSLRVDDFTVQVTTVDPPPEGQPPTAVINLTQAGQIVAVDGSGSSDPDGTVASYKWDFGDGGTATGAQPQQHEYAQSGTYTITLTVTDNEGLTGEATQDVTVDSSIGIPGPDNTGVPEGTDLTTLSSSTIPYPDDDISGTKFYINTPGAVYDGFRFPYHVEVRAPNVTVRNSFFEGANGGGGGLLAVSSDPKFDNPGVFVQDSSMIPKFPNNNTDGVRGDNYTLLRVEITGTVDGTSVFGWTDYNDPNAGRVLVAQSWIHDLPHFDDDSHSDGSHNDGSQIQGGSGIVYAGNVIDGEIYNAVFMIKRDRNEISDVVIAANRIGGGSCSVNVYDGNEDGAIEGLAFYGNTVERGTQEEPDCAAVISDRTKKVSTAQNNRWSDGEPLGPQSELDGFAWNDARERWERVRAEG